jgi:hypothetical protein
MSHPRSLSDVSPDDSDSDEDSEAFLVLDDAQYHRVDTSNIPAAYAECTVRFSNHGDEFDAGITAGLVGWQVCDSGVDEVERDTVRPVCGWWVYEMLPEGQVKEEPSMEGKVC